MMQALAGFWQMFVRQRTIAGPDADAALAALIQPFTKVQKINAMCSTPGKRAYASCSKRRTLLPLVQEQDHVMDLLAGTKVAGDTGLSDAHQQMIQDMIRVFESPEAGLARYHLLAWRIAWRARRPDVETRCRGSLPAGCAHHRDSASAHCLNLARPQRILRRLLD